MINLCLFVESKAPGVVLVTGDVHLGEMNFLKCNDGLLLPEFTTSGMTHSWNDKSLIERIALFIVRKVTKSPFQSDVLDFFTSGRNFGEIEINLDQEENEEMIFRLLSSKGNLLHDYTMKLNTLKQEGTKLKQCLPISPLPLYFREFSTVLAIICIVSTALVIPVTCLIGLTSIYKFYYKTKKKQE